MSVKLGKAPMDLLKQLEEAASATVSGTLYRKGYRFIYMAGVQPLQPGAKLVGQAVTLRYLPYRPDHAPTPEKHPQNMAVASLGEGDVLVVDARGNTSAGVFGDLVIMQMKLQGAAGLVTDGALRDTPFIRTLDFPCFCKGTHGFAHIAEHVASDVNITLSCGNVLVDPGDIILGDDDGVVVIPRKIAEEVAKESVEQERREIDYRNRIEKGEPASIRMRH